MSWMLTCVKAPQAPFIPVPIPPTRSVRGMRRKRTYLVTLKIRNNLRARNTLIPNDVPGFMTAQTTSKMLPMMTCRGA